jgi:hypothetical protein
VTLPGDPQLHREQVITGMQQQLPDGIALLGAGDMNDDRHQAADAGGLL